MSSKKIDGAADPSSLLNGQNIAFLEDVYEQFLEDPNSVTKEWQAYFSELASQNPVGANNPASKKNAPTVTLDSNTGVKQGAVSRLISTYRAMGHKKAAIDPINEMLPPVA